MKVRTRLAFSAPNYESEGQEYPVQASDDARGVRLDFSLQPKSPALAEAVTQPVFGPLIERVVSAAGVDARNSCLDLDSAQLLDLPGSWPAASVSESSFSNAWQSLTPVIIRKGIDLVGGENAESLRVFLASMV